MGVFAPWSEFWPSSGKSSWLSFVFVQGQITVEDDIQGSPASQYAKDTSMTEPVDMGVVLQK